MDTKAVGIRRPHRDATIAVYQRAALRVIGHLRDNLGEDHTLHDMADVAMLSPFHFNRIFREVTGVSPIRYLYALRIAEAAHMLVTTRLKVIEICYAVGYNSLGSFNNRFVSLVGYSPRQVRSLANCIDPADLRRRIEARVASRVFAMTEPCSIRGRVHAPDDFSGVLLVALFRGPPSNSHPIACGIAEDGVYALPPVRQDGNYWVMAVGLAWQDRMEQFLSQPVCLRGILPPIRITRGGLDNPIDFILEPGQPIDPPIPPAFAFHVLGDPAVIPEDPADYDKAPPLFFPVPQSGPQQLPSHG